MSAITWEANQLGRTFIAAPFGFATRDCNGAAHGLASLGMENHVDTFWVEDAPNRILQLVDLDNRFAHPP